MLTQCSRCKTRFETYEPEAECPRCGRGRLGLAEVAGPVVFAAAWLIELARVAREPKPATPGIDPGGHIEKPLCVYDVLRAERARRGLDDHGARYTEIYYRYLIGENNNPPNRKQAEVGYGFDSGPSRAVAETVAHAWPFDRPAFDRYELGPLVSGAPASVREEASRVVLQARQRAALHAALDDRRAAEHRYANAYWSWRVSGGRRPALDGLSGTQAKQLRVLVDDALGAERGEARPGLE